MTLEAGAPVGARRRSWARFLRRKAA